VIYSGVTGWFDGYYDLVADGFEGMRGTSMATPHTAGLVALLAEAVPDITVDDIKNVMRRQKEKDYIEGWGMIKLSLFR
jgi:subtilisin family serine protease